MEETMKRRRRTRQFTDAYKAEVVALCQKDDHSIAQGAHIRRVRPHGLWHTMATLVLRETKDVKLVATRLAHANEYLVARTYGHLMPGVDRAAIDFAEPAATAGAI